MFLHGGRLVARVLKNENVTHVFTLCGGHIVPIYNGCVDEGIRVVDTRHEQAAAHAADAYSRLTRCIGVAAVTAAQCSPIRARLAAAKSQSSPVSFISSERIG